VVGEARANLNDQYVLSGEFLLAISPGGCIKNMQGVVRRVLEQ